MELIQPRGVINLMNTVEINPDRTIVLPSLDNTVYPESKLHTPVYRVSELAKKVQKLLNNGTFTPTQEQLTSEFLLAIKNNKRRYTQPRVYILMHMVLLESFAVLYAIDNEPLWAKDITKGDAHVFHANLNYVLEVLGGERENSLLIEKYREMETDTLYSISVLGGVISAL